MKTTYFYKYEAQHSKAKLNNGDWSAITTGRFQTSREYNKQEAEELITKMNHGRLQNVTILELNLIDKTTN